MRDANTAPDHRLANGTINNLYSKFERKNTQLLFLILYVLKKLHYLNIN
jgi:hypothetical protein